MLIQYKFKLHGRIKPNIVFPLIVGERTYEFELEGQFINFIIVKFPITEDNYPITTPKPSGGVALAINANEPDAAQLKQEMRQVEGLLSIYGCESIDTQHPEIKWLPESNAEREKLRLFSFSSKRAPLKDHEIPPVSFDLIARPLLAAARERSEIPSLSFYRKGSNDMKEDRYIDAIYDFFFCLEFEYGQGKTKNYALEEAFLSSNQLVDIIAESVNDKLVFVGFVKQDTEIFASKYQNKSPQEIVNRLILLRGFLHHQSNKRADIWAPDEHDRFRVDANLLRLIAYRVVWLKYEKYVSDPAVIENYRDCYIRQRSAS